MPRLNRDDWITAGLQALRAGGPDAVAVQTLAPAIGATKGSFYWHFGSRDELLDAVLERWLAESTERFIEQVDARGGDPAARLRRLFAAVTGAATAGEQRILAAADHPVVGPVVRAATERRIRWVATVLREAGIPRAEAARRASFGYTWYLGHAQLTAIDPGALPSRAARRRTLEEGVAFLLSASLFSGPAGPPSATS